MLINQDYWYLIVLFFFIIFALFTIIYKWDDILKKKTSITNICLVNLFFSLPLAFSCFLPFMAFTSSYHIIYGYKKYESFYIVFPTEKNGITLSPIWSQYIENKSDDDYIIRRELIGWEGVKHFDTRIIIKKNETKDISFLGLNSIYFWSKPSTFSRRKGAKNYFYLDTYYGK